MLEETLITLSVEAVEHSDEDKLKDRVSLSVTNRDGGQYRLLYTNKEFLTVEAVTSTAEFKTALENLIALLHSHKVL